MRRADARRRPAPRHGCPCPRRQGAESKRTQQEESEEGQARRVPAGRAVAETFPPCGADARRKRTPAERRARARATRGWCSGLGASHLRSLLPPSPPPAKLPASPRQLLLLGSGCDMPAASERCADSPEPPPSRSAVADAGLGGTFALPAPRESAAASAPAGGVESSGPDLRLPDESEVGVSREDSDEKKRSGHEEGGAAAPPLGSGPNGAGGGKSEPALALGALAQPAAAAGWEGWCTVGAAESAPKSNSPRAGFSGGDLEVAWLREELEEEVLRPLGPLRALW